MGGGTAWGRLPSRFCSSLSVKSLYLQKTAAWSYFSEPHLCCTFEHELQWALKQEGSWSWELRQGPDASVSNACHIPWPFYFRLLWLISCAAAQKVICYLSELSSHGLASLSLVYRCQPRRPQIWQARKLASGLSQVHLPIKPFADSPCLGWIPWVTLPPLSLISAQSAQEIDQFSYSMVS